MPKTVLKRWLGFFDLRRHDARLGLLGRRLHEPDLWHLNRRSVAGAFANGLFMAFQPIPFQMLAAAAAAILFRVNVPISILLVWISNPFTIPPILYGSYRTGAFVLQIPTRDFTFELSREWLMAEIGYIWQPLLVGSFIFSSVAAMSGYTLIRILWRIRVAGIVKARRLRPRMRRFRRDAATRPDDRQD